MPNYKMFMCQRSKIEENCANAPTIDETLRRISPKYPIWNPSTLGTKTHTVIQRVQQFKGRIASR